MQDDHSRRKRRPWGAPVMMPRPFPEESYWDIYPRTNKPMRCYSQNIVSHRQAYSKKPRYSFSYNLSHDDEYSAATYSGNYQKREIHRINLSNPTKSNTPEQKSNTDIDMLSEEGTCLYI